MIRGREQGSIYAIIAPAFVGQFGADVDDAQIKDAIMSLGFDDVFEVAMAADIITLREAEEYVRRVDRGEQFVITSCCCPAFLKLVAKVEPASAHLVSDSVSPMIALGRLLKAQNPNARVVFIGPCLAKKAESYQEGLRDAIDGVLTFKEIASLLETAGLNVAAVEGEAGLQDASHDGRIYAYTGGVSEAIIRAIQQMRPDLEPETVRGNGIKQCREILQAVERGELAGTFMEGMACVGGCLGGPGNIVREADEIAPLLRAYARTAASVSAKENAKASSMMMDYGQKTSFELHLPN
jgi:iron only hydrogenase large subunit-like protein